MADLIRKYHGDELAGVYIARVATSDPGSAASTTTRALHGQGGKRRRLLWVRLVRCSSFAQHVLNVGRCRRMGIASVLWGNCWGLVLYPSQPFYRESLRKPLVNWGYSCIPAKETDTGPDIGAQTASRTGL
jgi:hypothetical protein